MIHYVWVKSGPNFIYKETHYKLTGQNYVCRIFNITPKCWNLYICPIQGGASFFRMRFDTLKSAKTRAEIIFGAIEGGDQL